MMKGLPNRGESRCLECCFFDVVETNHRHILRNPQLCIMKCANGAKSGNIIEGKNCSEAALVSQQLPGFDDLKVGDQVDVLYKNALLVKAGKVSGTDKGSRKRSDKQVVTPTSGGFESARQVEVLATVQKIDRKTRLVTLRGAYQTQTLEAGPDVDLSDLKVGDTIHAVFVSAAAVEVKPVAQ